MALYMCSTRRPWMMFSVIVSLSLFSIASGTESLASDGLGHLKEMGVVDDGSSSVVPPRKHISSSLMYVNDVSKEDLIAVPGLITKDIKTTIIPAQFQLNYTESVNITNQIMFVYNYTETNETTAVRVHVSCSRASSLTPVMFSARQQEGVVAWSVPLDISDSYTYLTVSRTLCPVNKPHQQGHSNHQYIFVEVSSMVQQSAMFHLRASLIENFELQHNSPRSTEVVAAQPKYYKYLFPDGVDQVLLRVTSKTDVCMVVSVQNIKCPVLDLENNIEFEGKHQTMTTQAALYLQRSDFDHIDGFYVVLLVRSNDEACHGKLKWYDILPPGQKSERSKTVEIKIQKAATTKQYIVATLTAVGVLLGFYLIAFLMGFLYTACGSHKVLDDLTEQERGDGERSYFNAQPSRTDYGAVGQDDGVEVIDRSKELGNILPSSSGAPSHQNSLVETSSLNEEEIDFLPDSEMEKDVYRTKISMFVSDLSRKKRSKMNKYYNLYVWNLVSLAIFYALPVIQLVITYQRVLLKSGNEDICYYNFDCANPLKSYLSSFNNVFSNIGYVLLGLLFILIVRSRHVLYSRTLERHSQTDMLGIPQHYGLFYAMGFALIMEGVMSGSYHVCPNYSNFQFDTSFMYIIACLCMLRIYQNRHTDISAKSHTAYFSMAFVIFIAVIGVVYSTNIFWIFYALIHMLFTFLLSAQVYFLGRWRIGWSSFKRFILFLINDLRRCSRPVSPKNRFIMLVIGNIINWTFILYGAIKQPSDFASYLLAIFIGNLLLYCLFYVIMKLLSGERISPMVMLVMLIAVILWCCSLYFFFQHLTTWQKTPSGSREGNKECILLDFYDSHDVWHFLSAFSLFFSFMILLLLDDDVSLKPRNQIPVF